LVWNKLVNHSVLVLSGLLQEKEAIALAGQLEDRSYALDKLLGPALHPEGSRHRLKSEEAKALTEQLYTPDR
jgi:hypothetical protein